MIDVSISSSNSSITTLGCSSKKLATLVQIARASISRARVISSIPSLIPSIAVEDQGPPRAQRQLCYLDRSQPRVVLKTLEVTDLLKKKTKILNHGQWKKICCEAKQGAFKGILGKMKHFRRSSVTLNLTRLNRRL